MHVLSINQFNPKQLKSLIDQADTLRELANNPKTRRDLATRHIGRQLYTLFYEPSTRTRTSFEAAAIKMGMGVVSTENARDFSSAIKGETIEDTIRVLNEYDFDVIVMRHHETGAALKAAKVSNTPILNAGDGKGEHPTQSLLDAYTIIRAFGKLEGLHVVMGGDLANGRTVRSLAQLLSMYKNNKITFVSIPELQIGKDIKQILKGTGTKFEETDNMDDAISDADVIYWTRLQKERIANPESIPKGGFIINTKSLKLMRKDAIIMHPLPRVDEIDAKVDLDPRAQYFQQAGNGLYIRMALIDHILNKVL